MYQNKRRAGLRYTTHNNIELIRGGKPYFDILLSLINNATVSIHLQTYIFNNDQTGTLVMSALQAAAKRNVQVYLLADGYASQALSKSFIHLLNEYGINFRFFEPFFKSRNFYFGRRLHHKVFVADEKIALVGGVNVADRYNDIDGIPAWLDFAILVEGEVVQQLYLLCVKTWDGFAFKKAEHLFKKNPLQLDLKQQEMSLVRIRRNDWVQRKNEISATYFEMLRHSSSHITILCSYFLPGKIIRKLLKQAAIRGVKIRVITAGPSDVMVAKHAERWMYDWLLRNNIVLYEYQAAVLHAKVAVCDSEWLTIGSYNINNISAYASIELNLDIRNAGFAAGMERTLEDIILHDCIPITKESHLKNNNIVKQFVRWCSYQFIRFAFYVITFYYKQN
jgi:cardiolipin synthase